MVLENQNLFIKNLLSFRKQLYEQGLENEIMNFEKYIIEMGANRTSPFINAVHGINDNGLLDIEVYTGINKIISSNKFYIFKNEIFLHNCLKISHYGDPSKIQNTAEKLNKYIFQNNFVTLSPVFNINVTESNNEGNMDNFQMDMYVSVVKNINIY